jgi:hypothetical protein
MRLLRAWIGLGALGLALVGLSLPARAQDDPYQGLPAGAGRDDVLAWCSGCHAMPTVTQQGMSRSRWDDTIDWMISEHNMPKPTDAERKVLLDYLTAHYNESRGGGGCVETPWGRRCS